MRRMIRCVVAALCLVSLGAVADAPQAKFGGHFELDYEDLRNFDLNSSRHRDFITLEAEVRLRLEAQFSEQLDFVGQIRPRRKFDLHDEDRKRERDFVIELEEIYLGWNISEALRLKVGRERYRDRREWLYDANMDGAHLEWKHNGWRLDALAAREQHFSADLLRNDRAVQANNTQILVERELRKDWFVSGYWLHRDFVDGSPELRNFFGLNSRGKPIKAIEYWLDIVRLYGRNESNVKRRAWAIDFGAQYRFDAKLRPHLLIGYGLGSGDNDTNDAVDRGFRQTGMFDNSGRTSGSNRYKFYGEVFEPELANLSILSVGAGFWPLKHGSLELIYHRYRQDHAADSLGESNLETDPAGSDRDIGEGLDLVFGFEDDKKRINASIGRFLPGKAFTRRDKAYFMGVEARFYF